MLIERERHWIIRNRWIMLAIVATSGPTWRRRVETSECLVSVVEWVGVNDSV